MAIVRKKMIVVMLLVLLGTTAVANAASGITACPPAQCCCTPAPMAEPDHIGSMDIGDHTATMNMEMPSACAPNPKEPASCCNLETDVQPIELAISTVTNFDPNRIMAAYLAAGIHFDTPLERTRPNFHGDVGWPKIQKVPIFLQTLSILC